MNKNKGKKKCPFCGSWMPKKTEDAWECPECKNVCKICPDCGKLMERDIADHREWECENCGRTERSCSVCGSPMEANICCSSSHSWECGCGHRE